MFCVFHVFSFETKTLEFKRLWYVSCRFVDTVYTSRLLGLCNWSSHFTILFIFYFLHKCYFELR